MLFDLNNRATAVTVAERNVNMIRDNPKIWIISKSGLDPLEIEVSSFDEAIRKEREINKEYNTGQLKEILP